jgi:hypothetical protein
MNLDKIVDMLTDEQLDSLDPIIDFLNDYSSEKSGYVVTSSQIKETILLEAYKSKFASDENYRSVIDACSEKIMNLNTIYMLLNYSNENHFVAMHYLKKNQQIYKLINSEK